jgi:hypothetical protein
MTTDTVTIAETEEGAMMTIFMDQQVVLES